MKTLALAVVCAGAAIITGCAAELGDEAITEEGSAAITRGQSDFTHTGVGAMVATNPSTGEKQAVCSGTLIAPDVFLTAGHCVYFTQLYGFGPPVWVTFDQHVTASSTLIPAEMHAPEGYVTNAIYDAQDIGVLVLSQPQRDRPLARLPSAGRLDTVLAHGTPLTVVGYGSASIGPGQQFAATNERRSGTVTVNSLVPEFVIVSELGVHGNDGECHGDSGGPMFASIGGVETLVAIVTAGDGACHAQGFAKRTDTASTRTFLDDYVTLR